MTDVERVLWDAVYRYRQKQGAPVGKAGWDATKAVDDLKAKEEFRIKFRLKNPDEYITYIMSSDAIS